MPQPEFKRVMETTQLTPEEIQARVLHRDGLMLVIDKPAGIPVHRGPKGGANLEASFEALRFGLPRPPVLAHRLDRDTSGCLVLGRHRKATASLGLLFKHGKISKTYWAVVEGGPTEDEGTIDIPLGRLNQERGWWQKPDPNGLPSVTKWNVLGRGVFTAAGDRFLPPGVTGELSPAREEGRQTLRQERGHRKADLAGAGTGHRTHPSTARALRARAGRSSATISTGRRQVCAACAMNQYIPRFGEPGLHLHAREIAIPLSKNKPPVVVTAPVPVHLHERLKACGWNGA